MTATTIAIIGGGFSGTAMALDLLRATGPSVSVVLIERGARFAAGQAYSTVTPTHLLNVPAARMSANDAEPGQFVEWLRTQGMGDAGIFVPRQLYGAYLRDLLTRAEATEGRRLELVRGDAVSLTPGARIDVALRDGRIIQADRAVLAVGNYPPASAMPGALLDSPRYRANPWAPAATAGLDADAAVLLVGTGLTMVDVVSTLLDAGHHGRILAVSRRGLVPQRHAGHKAATLPKQPDYPRGLVALLRCLRADAAACVAAGGSWQDAVDRFRPLVQATWTGFSEPDRLRFLRHARPWWDCHRHRIAQAVADRIDAARASGQLRIAAGRIRSATEQGAAIAVSVLPRHTGTVELVEAARVIDCTGPAADYRQIGDPLVRNLLESGVARPHRLHMGLDVTPSCAVIGADGPSARIFAMGPVTRGAFWEVTAVPDIRVQCHDLAGHIAERLPAG